MSAFTASNGVRILDRAHGIGFQYPNDFAGSVVLSPTTQEALAEYFQAREDERLGRWRWAKNPAYAVYPSVLYRFPPSEDQVMVVNESNGQSHIVRRDEEALWGYFSEAGRAYFDAHPEPKPWHDAKPGEVWVVTIDGHSRPHYVEDNRSDTVGGIAFVAVAPTHGQPGHVGINAPAVSDARRIWPEAD